MGKSSKINEIVSKRNTNHKLNERCVINITNDIEFAGDTVAVNDSADDKFA